MASLRCATRLASLTRVSQSVFARLPGFAGGQAHTAVRASPLLVRACAAAAELAKQPVLDNKMFCYQVRGAWFGSLSDAWHGVAVAAAACGAHTLGLLACLCGLTVWFQQERACSTDLAS